MLNEKVKVLLDHLNIKHVWVISLLCLQHVCLSIYLMLSVTSYNVNGQIQEGPNFWFLSAFVLPCRPQQRGSNEVSGYWAQQCVHTSRNSANTQESIRTVGLWRRMKGHVTCSEVSPLFGWQRGSKKQKTEQHVRSYSCSRFLSSNVKGNHRVGRRAANFQFWTKRHQTHYRRGSTSSCAARQKDYPWLWGKTKGTSMNATEVFERLGEVAAVPPDWCERKTRCAESIDTVSIGILLVLRYI